MYSSKINKIRSFALFLIFAGFIVMYGGIYFKDHLIIASGFLLVGVFAIIASVLIYFWIGLLSTKATQIVCPSCNKVTKMLGKVDICMHCRESLTLDKRLEGKNFDEAYNRRN